jgi:aryl-alcohol dehydrogenase-like predicted oxidoreductase
MGRVGNRQSLRAIAAALDAGINHFDIARSYGYGEAEGVLGAALKGHRRDQIVIATKVGITPPAVPMLLQRLKPLVRTAVTVVPSLRKTIRRSVAARAAHGNFTTAFVKSSLEHSLKALGTDYVDILFLHSAAPEDVTDELMELLSRQASAGRVRALGVASSAEHAIAISQRWPVISVRQFANSLVYRAFVAEDGIARLTHSPFAGVSELAAAYSRNKDIFEAAGVSIAERRRLHALMLQFSLAENPAGLVICSMLSRDHLRENLSVLDAPAFNAAELAAAVRLCGQLFRTNPSM